MGTMKWLITLPIFFVLIFGFALELIDIAETTSSKVIYFADEMNNAMECATKGIHISECSPELLQIDFSPEINRTMSTLNQFKKDAGKYVDIEELYNNLDNPSLDVTNSSIKEVTINGTKYILVKVV